MQYEDEPPTPEDEQALVEAREEAARSELVPWEDVKRSLRISA
jgi:hypothetical protein